MSRLYVKLNSDTRKNPTASTGSKRISASFNVGSANDSTTIAEVYLNYNDIEKRYTLHVDTIDRYRALKVYYNRKEV